ncbi:MAG: tRNA lysidine(34) synthetase TilS, partial [Bacteroidota bacterium]
GEVKNLKPQRLLLFNLLQEYGFNESTVDDVITSLDKHSGRTFESNYFRLILDRDKLILLEKSETHNNETIINSGDHEARFGRYKLNILHDDSPLIVKNNPMAVSVDVERLAYPLTLRCWQQGDTFNPLGMKGRKKVSDYFISQKIPLHKKEEIPLLVNGNGDVIWIGGYRLDDNYKVSANTKKVTIFELILI